MIFNCVGERVDIQKKFNLTKSDLFCEIGVKSESEVENLPLQVFFIQFLSHSAFYSARIFERKCKNSRLNLLDLREQKKKLCIY